jgi:hypothetical protein
VIGLIFGGGKGIRLRRWGSDRGDQFGMLFLDPDDLKWYEGKVGMILGMHTGNSIWKCSSSILRETARFSVKLSSF